MMSDEGGLPTSDEGGLPRALTNWPSVQRRLAVHPPKATGAGSKRKGPSDSKAEAVPFCEH